MKTLRELALEKYKERQQDDLEAQKAKYEKNTEITRKAFIRLCGCEPEKVAGLTVEDNGLTLVYQYGNHPAIWAVRDQCPNCKNLVLSTACYSLADIGKQIEDFQPYDHDCPMMDSDKSYNPDKLGDNNGQNYIQKLTDFSWTGS